MPWLQQWLSHLHESAEGTDNHFHAQVPPKVGTRKDLGAHSTLGPAATDNFAFLRSAAGRRHLASFLDSDKATLSHGSETLGPLHGSKSRASRGMSNSFLDATASSKRSLHRVGASTDDTLAVTPVNRKGRVRLHRTDQTSFEEEKKDGKEEKPAEGEAKERKKKDPLIELPFIWLTLYRVAYWGGLGISIFLANKLDEAVEERSGRKVDHDKAPIVRRFLGMEAVEEDGDGRPRADRTPSHDVVSQATDVDGLRVIGDNVVRYDEYMFLRPLRRLKFTILDDWAVIQAQASVMIYFFIMAILTIESTHMGRSVLLIFFNDILTLAGGTKRLEDFIKTITAFTSFFLGMFTTLTLNRWIRLWEDGLLRIFRGTEKLVVMLGTDLPNRVIMTVDPTQPPREVDRNDVVRTYIRWSKAAICMLFQRYGSNVPVDDMLDSIRSKGYITDEEHGILSQIENGHPQAVMAWQFKMIYLVCKDSNGPGCIPTQPFHIIHNEITFGVTNIMETLKHPFPFSYISLISMFVKFMNVTVATTGGILTSRALMHHSETEAAFDFLFVFVVTLLTHSVVILNLYLANPFQDHFTSMCPDDLVNRLDQAATAGRVATNLPPQIIATKWEKKTPK